MARFAHVVAHRPFEPASAPSAVNSAMGHFEPYMCIYIGYGFECAFFGECPRPLCAKLNGANWLVASKAPRASPSSRFLFLAI